MGVDAIIEIGPRTNIRRMTQRGFAPYLTVASMRPQGTGAPLDPTRPYADTVSNLYYSHQLGGYILQPIFGWQDMHVEDMTFANGAPVALAYPPKGYRHFDTGNPVAFLQLGTVGNAVDVTVTSNGVIPACSSFVLSLAKWAAPPNGTKLEDIHYTFTFGGSYRLTWGAAEVPVLAQEVNGTWTELKRGRVADNERSGYIAEATQDWQFYVLGNDLYIICSVLQYPMILRNLGLAGQGYLPPATWSFRVQGLPVMMNLTELRFQRDGYFETVIDHTHVYPDPDGSTPTGVPFFPPKAFDPHPYPRENTVGCYIDGKVMASAGSKKRYRLTLHGNSADVPAGASYSTRTPYLAAWQPELDPTFDAADNVTDLWLPVQQYFQEGKVTLSAGLEANRFTGSILLQARKGEAQQTFREFLTANAAAYGLDPLLRGAFCVRVRVRDMPDTHQPVLARVASLPPTPSLGDRYLVTAGDAADSLAQCTSAGETVSWLYTAPREGMAVYITDEAVTLSYVEGAWGAEEGYTTVLTGFGLTVQDLATPGMDTVQLDGYDRFVQLARVLGDAPCGIGRTPETAIKLWAQYVGVHPDALILEETGRTLDDPQRNYQTPPHLPQEGGRATEMIGTVLKRTGQVFLNHGDGTATVAKSRHYTPVARYYGSSDPAADIYLQQLALPRSLLDAANYFRLRGRDPDGVPFLHHRWDQASIDTPGSESYLGEPVLAVLDLPDVVDRATLTLDAEKVYNRRPSGRPQGVQLSSRRRFAKRRPEEAVTVYHDAYAPSGRNFIIVGVDMPLMLLTDEPIVLTCLAPNPEEVAEVASTTGYV